MEYPDSGILFELKRHGLSNHEKIWRKLKCMWLNGRSQSEKAAYCVTPAL